MSNLTPLTSKSGESEWQYEGKTYIAIPGNDPMCLGCCLKYDGSACLFGVPCCLDYFDQEAVFIENPAEK